MLITEGKNVIFVSARRGYITEGIRAEGFDVVYPYRDKTLIEKIIREIWFKCGLPERLWYTKIKKGIDNIIVQDPLITKGYLEWLKETHQNSKIHFMYGNLVGQAKHVLPNEIPARISVWTYDSHDSKKFGLNLYQGGYSSFYIGVKKVTKYDVFYVGADKGGRGEFLLDLQRQMEKLGLKTKYIITPASRFAKKKSYYSKPIPYSKVVEYVNESRAVLNIVMPNQTGATIRDFESIFNEVKLITNNLNIKSYAFYKEENVFILGERNLSELSNFLSSPFIPVEKEILEKYTIPVLVEEIVKMNKTFFKIKCKENK